jgi:hypothetical protein
MKKGHTGNIDTFWRVKELAVGSEPAKALYQTLFNGVSFIGVSKLTR